MTAFDTHSDYPADDFTASLPDEEYPAPSSAHLLSEIGYANLPPPPSPAALEDRAPSSNAVPSPDAAALWREQFAPQWVDLLQRAATEPGLVGEAYTRFHGYSLGNRFAALLQCQMRGLEPGPIHTFLGWKKLGYGVCEGEKALVLCMPIKGVLAREKPADPAKGYADPLPDIEEIEFIRTFLWKPHWFVLSQTAPLDPEQVTPLTQPALNGWDKALALHALNIEEVPFQEMNGNVQGYAVERSVAVSPLAPHPFKTFFHEMAHVVLGHTRRDREGGEARLLVDSKTLSRSEIEVEAEGVALLLLDTLDLPGQEFSRGYIQHWLQGGDITEKSAQRIFGAADRILNAGTGEGRRHLPTADDVAEAGWPVEVPATNGIASNGVAHNGAINGANGVLPPNGTQSNGNAVAEGSALEIAVLESSAQESPAFNGALQPTVMIPGNGAAHPSPRLIPVANGDSGHAQASSVAEVLDQRAFEDESQAWKLHGRLLGLHAELHPEERAERVGFQRALRHLKSWDPIAAHQIQELVQEASRSLKFAYRQLETVLEAGLTSANEETATANNSDNGSTTHTTYQNGGEHTNGSAPHNGNAPQKESPHAEPNEEASTNGVLPPTRAAAARATFGRSLRAELRFEKARFFDAAKEHGLKTRGQYEKAMWTALSEFWGEPVSSRRTPSSRQWARAASALETEDLSW